MANAALSAETPEPEKVIYHGVNWLQLGPGVISNCMVARLRLGGGTVDSVLIAEPAKIAVIKRWALRNIYCRFDLSPEEPIESDGNPVPFLSLYSWRTHVSQPRWDFSTTPPYFLAPRVVIDEDLLVFIPLLPGVLGLTESECAQEVAELAKLVPVEKK